MTPEQLIGIIAVLFGLLVLIAGFFLRNLYKDVSELTKQVVILQERSRVSEVDRNGLRDWKHRVVDPYVPACIDDHERRVERIERHLNGHLK